MTQLTYRAFVAPSGAGYGIVFPELPGCISHSTTLRSAAATAEEALALHLAGLREEMLPLPAALPIDAPLPIWADVPPAAQWLSITAPGT